MSQRIKGQEVDVAVLANGEPQDLTTAKSAELAFKTEILQEGYLGHTTDLYDTIFKGVRGRVDFHFDSPAVLNVIRSIVNTSRRRTPGEQVNIKMTMNFPSGQKARVVVRDAQFGEMPLSFGSRSDYGSFSLDFAASEAQLLPIN